MKNLGRKTNNCTFNAILYNRLFNKKEISLKYNLVKLKGNGLSLRMIWWENQDSMKVINQRSLQYSAMEWGEAIFKLWIHRISF